jgi:hypothetical protein
MQMFIAEVSNVIDKAAFEQSWDSDSAIDSRLPSYFRLCWQKNIGQCRMPSGPTMAVR